MCSTKDCGHQPLQSISSLVRLMCFVPLWACNSMRDASFLPPLTQNKKFLLHVEEHVSEEYHHQSSRLTQDSIKVHSYQEIYSKKPKKTRGWGARMNKSNIQRKIIWYKTHDETSRLWMNLPLHNNSRWLGASSLSSFPLRLETSANAWASFLPVVIHTFHIQNCWELKKLGRIFHMHNLQICYENRWHASTKISSTHVCMNSSGANLRWLFFWLLFIQRRG